MSNLKPFNLEEALAGKPVVTRDGRKVTEIYHFKTADQKNYPITAIIDGGKRGYSLSGKFIGDSSTTDSDLFMAPESIEVWVTIWQASDGRRFSTSDEKEPEDVLKSRHGYIKTEKFTINLYI